MDEERAHEVGEIIEAIRSDPAYEDMEIKKHGRHHAENVLRFSMMLADRVEWRGEPVDRKTLAAAALLHDCGRERPYSDPMHPQRGAERAMEIIERNQLDVDADKVYDAILGHYKGDWERPPQSIEGDILADADKLDRFRLGGEVPDVGVFRLPETEDLMGIAAEASGYYYEPSEAEIEPEVEEAELPDEEIEREHPEVQDAPRWATWQQRRLKRKRAHWSHQPSFRSSKRRES